MGIFRINISLIFFILHGYCLIAQNCDRYIPCQSSTLIYQAMKVGEDATFEIENETIEFTPAQGSLSFVRQIRVNVIGKGSLISITNGSIVINNNDIDMPSTYFLPEPLSIPGIDIGIQRSGSLKLPNTLEQGNALESAALKLDASTQSSGSSNNGFDFDASKTMKIDQQITNRQVLAVNQPITVAGQQLNSVVIRSQIKEIGDITTTYWTLSWYCLGIGLVKELYFSSEPSLNSQPNLGSKFLLSW